MIAKHCLVAGRVQGVFFRASTRERAFELGVVGYAKNLNDGRVEVLAVGEASQVDALVKWLWQGSPASHVLSVEVKEVSLRDLKESPREFKTA